MDQQPTQTLIDTERLAAQILSSFQKELQKQIEESSTQLRLDIQNVQKDFRKEIEESSTQLRLDIQKQSRKSSVQLRDIRKEIEESST